MSSSCASSVDLLCHERLPTESELDGADETRENAPRRQGRKRRRDEDEQLKDAYRLLAEFAFVF